MSNLFFLENPPRRFGHKSGCTVPPPIWFVNLNPAFRERFISSSYGVPSYADWHKISPNLRRVPPPCNRAVDVYIMHRCSPAFPPARPLPSPVRRRCSPEPNTVHVSVQLRLERANVDDPVYSFFVELQKFPTRRRGPKNFLLDFLWFLPIFFIHLKRNFWKFWVFRVCDFFRKYFRIFSKNSLLES